MKTSTFKQNYRSLVAAQKHGKGTPFYTRFVNRKLGQFFAAFLCQWNVSPNTITLVSGLITFSAYFSFLLLPHITFLQSLILLAFLIIGYGLDSADGLASRLLKKQSIVGEWLDHTFDAIKIPLGHGVAALMIINNGNVSIYMQILLLIFISIASAFFCANILKGKVREVEKIKKNIQIESKIKEKGDNGNHILRSIFSLPLDYGVFMAIFLFASSDHLFSIIYIIYGVFFTLFALFGFYRSYVELKIVRNK